MIKSFCLLLLLSLSTSSVVQAVSTRAQRQAAAQAAQASVAQASAAAVEGREVNPRKEHCDKTYRAISDNPAVDKDCADLEVQYNKLHKIIYGEDFNLGAADKGDDTDGAALGATEKLEQIHRATAEYLAAIVWRVLEKLRPAAANEYGWNGAAAGADHNLSGDVGWLALFNRDLANVAGAGDNDERIERSAQNVNFRRDLLVTMWVLDCFNNADSLEKVTLGHAAGGAGAFTENQLADAIAKKLWTFDMVVLAKILQSGIIGGSDAGWANMAIFNDGGFAARTHVHGGGGVIKRTGVIYLPAIDYGRVVAALNKLMRNP